MTEYNILQKVCKHLRDFYPILAANKTSSTEYLYPWFQLTVDRVTKLCFDLWTGQYKRYNDISQCSSVITSVLIDIIPLELEVLYICTFKLMKESSSTHELQVFVKQILKASPRILQNYLILLQGRMAGVVTVNYAPTQSINLMMEFLLIFLTDIPKSFIHSGKLNDMLAHIRVLTRKISILVSKLLEESSENNINKADFSAPDFLQEIERMKGDIRQIFLKAPESSQLRFPMDDDKALSHLIFSLPSVTDKIKLIVAQVTSLQLEDKNGDHPLDAKSFVEPIESTSSLFVEVTVGPEKEESQIIDQLLDEHESELDVISIVGMPGLGKTTLAKKVYNNTLVASHFKIRAWCTVSQKYNKSKVLWEILQQVTGSEEKGSEDDLAEKLRRALLDKSSLIMVDHILCKKSMPFSVRIKVCYVHDVVHDFCSEKAKKAKFFKLMNSGARFHASDFLHHRLTIHSNDGQLHKRYSAIEIKNEIATYTGEDRLQVHISDVYEEEEDETENAQSTQG
ncbi:hypothetical protein KY284_007665 [Solanum tuberosum]|nr:hypothetical protein KY284_007665 [Solanum tuberosum]